MRNSTFTVVRGRGLHSRCPAARSFVLVPLICLGVMSAHALAAPRAEAACSIDVGFTIKDGHYIKGSGSGSGSCGHDDIRITLQRKRWWGGENLVRVWTSGAPRSVIYNCSGSGTYTYSTIVEQLWLNQAIAVKESNRLRVSC